MKTNPLTVCKKFFISPETQKISKKGIVSTLTGTALGTVAFTVGTLALLTIFHYLPRENALAGTLGIKGSVALIATGGTLLSVSLMITLLLACRRKTIESISSSPKDETQEEPQGTPSPAQTDEQSKPLDETQEEPQGAPSPALIKQSEQLDETSFIKEKLKGESIRLVAEREETLRLVANARSYLKLSEVFIFKRLIEDNRTVWMIVRPPADQEQMVVEESENALNLEFLNTLTFVTPKELEAQTSTMLKQAGLKSQHLQQNQICYFQQEQVFILRETDPPKIGGIPGDLHYVIAPLEQEKVVRAKLNALGFENKETV